MIDHITLEIDGDGTQMLNYFYCSNDNANQDPASIVLTFLHQVLVQLPFGYNTIEEECEKWTFRGFNHESLQFDDIWALFRTTTEPYKRVYVIIDGFDEIEPNERWHLLDVINNLLSECMAQFKVLISSRDFPEISRIGRYNHLIIRSSDNETDIRKLVHMKTEKKGHLAQFGRDISPKTRQYIRHFLVQRARGMYVASLDEAPKGWINLLTCI